MYINQEVRSARKIKSRRVRVKKIHKVKDVVE